MEYIKEPISLYPNRAELLEKDMLDIINEGDFTSFSGFKQYWKENGISMIHQSIQKKELKEEFYQTIWGILTSNTYTDLMHIDHDIGIKSLYILYTIYFTQIHKPVLIPLTPGTVKILIDLSNIDPASKIIVSSLFKNKAFIIGMTEGVKSYVLCRKNIKENNLKIEDKIINSYHREISTKVQFKADKAHKCGMKYFLSREKIKEKLKDNFELFSNPNIPMNNNLQSTLKSLI
jgi:Small nuclear RNA activating complex (SNAPc), subunit 1